MLILKRYGVDVAPVAFDTMLASHVLDPDKLHNLDALSRNDGCIMRRSPSPR
ncbi:MAG: hypothetical protein IPM83_15770 [Ignavibacteria bacterium]|nr:hypothetical protein [Ignavibacteria bacterium]